MFTFSATLEQDVRNYLKHDLIQQGEYQYKI